MFELRNDQLTVTLLDPSTDLAYLGARYCAGGYIFQITDHRHGALLSGPTYPDAFNTFDGQGIPDAFNLSPLRAVGEPDAALIIGVGMCRLHPDYTQNTVTARCEWQVEVGDHTMRAVTSQVHADWSLRLSRVVGLSGRTVRSWTQLTNAGRAPIPMRWFPHPFFPHAGDALCRFNIEATFAAGEGYARRSDGWIVRQNWPWDRRGHYQPLDHHATERLVVQQRHPALGIVTATCSYVPDFFPIWGNSNTFSWEPFFERTIAPGQTLTWWIDYDF